MSEWTRYDLAGHFARVRERLATPDHWCKGSSARNADGVPCLLDDPAAVSFCLVGASEVSEGTVFSLTSLHALRFLQILAGTPMISRWQDETERTHADVLALLDRAIVEVDR